MKGEERMKAREDHERRGEDGAKEGHERSGEDEGKGRSREERRG